MFFEIYSPDDSFVTGTPRDDTHKTADKYEHYACAMDPRKSITVSPSVTDERLNVFGHGRPIKIYDRSVIATVGWDSLIHPPYSTDLAPSYFHLISALKKDLIVRHFDTKEEVKTDAKELSLMGCRTRIFLNRVYKLS